jgi:Spy/CpxP family protein refolding chaperone
MNSSRRADPNLKEVSKMRKYKISIILIISVILPALFCFPSGVYAQSDESKPGKPVKQREALKTLLKLTDEQQQKLKDIHQQCSNQLEDIQIGNMRRKLELAEEMRKDEPDRKKIDEILMGISQLELKKQKTIMDEFFAIRNILSPDQRTFFTRRFIRQMTGNVRSK